MDSISHNNPKSRKKDPAEETAKLISAISKGQDKSLKQKVAHILNHFPAARDSDITLTIRLLKTFYPEYVDGNERMDIRSMYELPKFYDMQRLRAKIQNDYGLFLASPEVAAFRKNKQYTKAEEFASKKPDYNSVFVFTDESGKTQDYLIFGSIWIYSPIEHIRLLKSLDDWRQKKKPFKEIHFAEINHAEHADIAIDFFKIALGSADYIGFKALVVDAKGVNSGRMTEAMYEGITQLLINGVKTDIKRRRATPPLNLHLAKDADPATDILKLSDLNTKTITAFQTIFPQGEATLESVANPLSEKSDLIQIADLFTGAIGRWVNIGVTKSDTNAKAQLAREIGNCLSFRIDKDDKRLITRKDFCVIEYLIPDVEVFREGA